MEFVKTNNNLVDILLGYILETFKNDKLILIDIFSFLSRLYVPNTKTKSIEITTLMLEPILSKVRNFPFIQSMVVYVLSEPEFQAEHLSLISFVLYLKLVLPDVVFVSIEHILWGRLKEKHPNSYTRCFMDFYKGKPFITTQLTRITALTGIPCNNLKVLLNGEIFEQIFVKRRSKITTKEVLINDMTRYLNIFEHKESVVYLFLKELFKMFIIEHKNKIDIAIKENTQELANDNKPTDLEKDTVDETGDVKINQEKLNEFLSTIELFLKEDFGSFRQILFLTLKNMINLYINDREQHDSKLNTNERNMKFANEVYNYLFAVKDFELMKLFNNVTGFIKNTGDTLTDITKSENIDGQLNKSKANYKNKWEREYVLNIIERTKNKMLVFVTCFNIYKKPVYNKVKINVLDLLDYESKALLEYIYTKENYESIKNGLERNVDDSLYQLKTAQVLIARLVLLRNSI